MIKEAIKICLEYRQRAILLDGHTTKVGACIYTKSKLYGGFNIQNRSHKSYHAEEVAVINYLLDKQEDEPTGIVVTFSKDDIERLTFACGHCRQLLWGVTKNKDLLVTEVDLDGNIIKSLTLEELYPYPYPK